MPEPLGIPEQFGRVGVLLLLALVFPALPLLISYAFQKFHIRPDTPDPVKNATSECGLEADGTAWAPFKAPP